MIKETHVLCRLEGLLVKHGYVMVEGLIPMDIVLFNFNEFGFPGL